MHVKPYILVVSHKAFLLVVSGILITPNYHVGAPFIYQWDFDMNNGHVVTNLFVGTLRNE
jgi:hypothetical protein